MVKSSVSNPESKAAVLYSRIRHGGFYSIIKKWLDLFHTLHQHNYYNSGFHRHIEQMFSVRRIKANKFAERLIHHIPIHFVIFENFKFFQFFNFTEIVFSLTWDHLDLPAIKFY